MAHVNAKKKQTVKEFAELVDQYPIVGALNMEGLPAKQLQNMRAQLQGQCVIRMAKRRLIKVAFKDAKKDGIDQLEPHLKGMPALLFTKENPFTLFKTLKKNKSPAPAKAGQIANADIKVTAQVTPFAPGPVIGELGAFGLKTGVENGKVAIKEDKIVCKEGEEISGELAGLLTRLDILPMEVGLDLTAVYEEGEIIPKSVLDIDEEQYMADLTAAASGAFNLGVHAGIMNAETTEFMVSKAVGEARSLAVEVAYLTPDTADQILLKAHADMMAVASHLPEELRPAGMAVAEAAPAQADPAPADEPKKEEKPEDDEPATGAGMSALFG